MEKQTLEKSSNGIYKEKGSTFHSILEPVSSQSHIKSLLISIKEEFPKANHICYAYRIKNGNALNEYYSDAGEPNGSAGKPILNMLKRTKLVNSAIFVIRFFGGTKLGIAGLINAYSNGAKDAIDNAELTLWSDTKILCMTYPYKFKGLMNSILSNNHVKVIKEDFGEEIHSQLKVDVEVVDKLIQDIKEMSLGSIVIREEK